MVPARPGPDRLRPPWRVRSVLPADRRRVLFSRRPFFRRPGSQPREALPLPVQLLRAQGAVFARPGGNARRRRGRPLRTPLGFGGTHRRLPPRASAGGRRGHGARGLPCHFPVCRGAGPGPSPLPARRPGVGLRGLVRQRPRGPVLQAGRPGVRRSFPRPVDRALYALIKERKYGGGCVDAWEQSAEALLASARAALAPSERTLRTCPFLFGERPTLADAALWGQVAMMRFAGIPSRDLGESLPAWTSRLERE